MSSVQVEVGGKQIGYGNPLYTMNAVAQEPRSQEEAADTENVVTITPAAGEEVHLDYFLVVIEGGSPSTDIPVTIEAENEVKYKTYIGSDSSESGFNSGKDIGFGEGNEDTITVGAGGTGINSVINYAYHTHTS